MALVKAGFLYGTCDSLEPKIYPLTNGVMMFHPEDPMHMPCYKARPERKA